MVRTGSSKTSMHTQQTRCCTISGLGLTSFLLLLKRVMVVMNELIDLCIIVLLEVREQAYKNIFNLKMIVARVLV